MNITHTTGPKMLQLDATITCVQLYPLFSSREAVASRGLGSQQDEPTDLPLQHHRIIAHLDYLQN